MAPESAHPKGFLGTQRTDAWWLEPALMVLFLGAFLVYSMFRVFEIATDPVVAHGAYHYVSPLVSLDLTGFIPGSWVASVPYLAYPALLVLPFPAGFRFTCYYFRRAYYRSFVARPAACGVEALKGDYKGEKGLLIFQNFHRYFLYATLILWAFHVVDAFKILFPHGHFYFGVGTVLIWIDVVLLGGYVLGCHALRHLIGGRLDCFSCTSISNAQHSMWQGVSRLNNKHALFGLGSIASIIIADFYLRWIDMNGITTVWGLPA